MFILFIFDFIRPLIVCDVYGTNDAVKELNQSTNKKAMKP